MPIELSELDLQNGGSLTGNFFQLLNQLETTIPIPNLFIVKFDIPSAISDEVHDTLGESPSDGKTNINAAANLFKDAKISTNTGFAVCNGINVNTETIAVDKVGNQVNGYLPISFNKNREFNPTDLSTQFIENVVSVADFIFKPWVRMVARNGGFSDTNLHTNLEILYLERSSKSGFFNFFSNTGTPSIRKVYTFYNCLPYNVAAEGIQTYADEPSLINKEIKWTFDRYDIKLPKK